MDNPTARRRPGSRITTAAAALAGATATGWVATADAAHLDHVRAALLAALIIATVVGSAALLAERQDRHLRQIARSVAQRRMQDRDDDVLEAATLVEIRAIRGFMGRITEALDANNRRWERRQEEVRAEAYVAGYLDRADGNPPSEPI